MAVATGTQTVRAQAKWVRTSARKARLVAEHIRGRSVPEARAVLAFTPRAAARELEKVLASAVANAEANHGLVGDDLIVHAALVDEGPTLKRWRARARGRVARIKKRSCHITLLLAPAEQEGPGGVPKPQKRSTEPQTTAPEAAEEKPKPKKPADRRTTKPKTKTAGATAKTASGRVRRTRRKAEEEK
jgi:ribosomal protein L22